MALPRANKSTRFPPRQRSSRAVHGAQSTPSTQFHSNSSFSRQSTRNLSVNLNVPPIPHSPLSTSELNSPESVLENEGDDICQVVMAIDMKDRGTVAVKLDIEPTVVILSTRADQDAQIFGTMNPDEATSINDKQFQLPYHLEIRPCQEFGFEAAKSKLMNLNRGQKSAPKFLVPGNAFSHEHVDGEDVGYTDQQGKFLNISGIVDMENCISVGCAGALITYLQRKQSAQYLHGDPTGDQAFQINAIEMRSLDGNMFINRDTLSSLQIIQSESHPNAFNQGPGKTNSGSKESLSIYGLFHRFARTPQGKGMLKKVFLRPTTKPTVIYERHNIISTFLRAENDDAMSKVIKSLSGIKNLRPIMIHLQKGISTGNAKFKGFKSIVWATILEFAFHAIDIHDTLKEVVNVGNLDLCVKAMHKLDLTKLHQVGRLIHETVDLESSVLEHRTIVKPRVNGDLDRLKEAYDGMDSLLSQVAVAIAATLPENISNELNVIYFPQLGFNIAIPLDAHGRAVYAGGDEAWTQVFNTENRAYFKDFRMREMDERLGDMYGIICEKEIEIVYDLAQRILGYEPLLVEASDICGEIDSLLALAQGASLYKLVRPQMTDENIVKIKGGRHLLQEASVPSYVPNDAVLVALIVYMAHIGSFVPADMAIIGLTDKILTRITTRETVSKTQSTFAIDLQQISFALTHCSRRSLIIIDEFGKGTESSGMTRYSWALFDAKTYYLDGIGLACGLFKHLIHRDEERPRVLAATHFHEIFENGFLCQTPELQFGHMEVQIDPTASEIEDQITYLYNFRSGWSSESFGTSCAAMNGIDPAIVSRANRIGEMLRCGGDIVAACAGVTVAELDVLEDAEIIARRFLQAEFAQSRSLPHRKGQFGQITSLLDEIIGGQSGTTSVSTEEETREILDSRSFSSSVSGKTSEGMSNCIS
ncbi:hypothetical protein LOZ39_005842 [Ophidiomyces ophidiicola]|uniref:uncharacterized protein n=1 Tax=Ophidiomyces ophidiicola TaxID=1387563 RepID=UPI0020C24296|nr:uncharacterized protein LOZ57_000185 [Ophidiomyces ophidiicola]KAI1937800.1 hypothetical protein LOZ62_005396 [Ophidiomyces ophidiicola]KAI1953844.1 hypothetical protein LOZ57_000185 [Ophidiomyces ophidiicola]KAI1967315.1 hypothetical protein LOZ56_005622 [Ophidiomyces ophidiicola]KAI2001828.1 hypothetical protein LOZ50_005395 [Ophidiomyces ophidiicola]KAI2068257.1 hypothetical protein LOZ39_005842 [Ophidiomyces ophidiicola]